MKRILLIALAVTACNSDALNTREVGDDIEVFDTEGPYIEHTPITDPQDFGADIMLDAIVEDPSDVLVAEVVYRHSTGGTGDWFSKRMNEVATGFYQGRILGRDHQSGGMRYYLRATDYEGNQSCLPASCGQESWYFPLAPN